MEDSLLDVDANDDRHIATIYRLIQVRSPWLIIRNYDRLVRQSNLQPVARNAILATSVKLEVTV